MKDGVSVVVAIFREPADEVVACVAPILAGPGPAEVIVLDQRGRPDVEAAVGALAVAAGNRLRYKRIPDRSLSYARNHGLAEASCQWVAFLDPDAIPAPGWLPSLRTCFAADHPAIIAGRIHPLYGREPNLVNRSQFVREQQSTLDLGDEGRDVDRAIGANFAVDRGAIGTVRFDEGLGRQGGLLLGGEETAFCAEVAAQGGRVRYCPGAVVQHRVPASRMRLRWLARRFYYGGVSRGLRGGRPAPITTHRRTWADRVALAMLGWPYAAGLVRGRLMRRKSQAGR